MPRETNSVHLKICGHLHRWNNCATSLRNPTKKSSFSFHLRVRLGDEYTEKWTSNNAGMMDCQSAVTSANICLSHPEVTNHIKTSAVTRNRHGWREDFWTPSFIELMPHLKQGEAFPKKTQYTNELKILPGISNKEGFWVWVWDDYTPNKLLQLTFVKLILKHEAYKTLLWPQKNWLTWRLISPFIPETNATINAIKLKMVPISPCWNRWYREKTLPFPSLQKAQLFFNSWKIHRIIYSIPPLAIILE